MEEEEQEEESNGILSISCHAYQQHWSHFHPALQSAFRLRISHVPAPRPALLPVASTVDISPLWTPWNPDTSHLHIPSSPGHTHSYPSYANRSASTSTPPQNHLNESSCSWPLCTFWIKLHLQVNAEFLQITTKPLQAKFLAQLDNLTDKLMQNFQGSKGAKGQKIKDIMAISSLYDDIDIKREHTLKSLVIYFNEDPDLLFKEYLTSSTEDERLRSTAATVTVFTPSEEKGFRSQRMLELSLKVLQL
ncbi:uncharacterized protein LOC113029323 [Astatotilapia calliptera]|uniref:uncharacterized protein LOC113029323 n=1 Tax=Astatotilapia calliptera TaxID=8154 RepID=UPI000E416F61|nr:uncharacterized protein LOC113029323 [Astatotilapia calliptera]